MTTSPQCRLRTRMLALAIFLVLLLVAGSPASSQPKQYALIFGTVWASNKSPVAGVKIRIRREIDKNPRWTLVSDLRGEFAQRVPAGKADYLVWAEGKAKRHIAETKVHVEFDERIDIGLHLTE